MALFGVLLAAIWIVPSQPVVKDEATTAVFERMFTNSAEIVRAEWTTTAHGVYEAYVNGVAVGGFLKPGFTEPDRCRHLFTFDVTSSLRCAKGAVNRLSAVVTEGWARDAIALGRLKDAAFFGSLRLEHADGTETSIETDLSWSGALGAGVPQASIYGGEVRDLRFSADAPSGVWRPVAESREFRGELRPFRGNPVVLRDDLAFKPVSAYVWRDVAGARTGVAHGTVVRTRDFAVDEEIVLDSGDNLVVDFGQNCSAEPEIVFSAASGTTLKVESGEMLNDGNGRIDRGNDGPGGSVYRANLRGIEACARVIASGGRDRYLPHFTFFGYRYLSVRTDGPVRILRIRSVPVSSVGKTDERGTVITGNADVNRLISNALWGMRSNYLSVPTDCPQRDERMGWTADTQVFAETGLYFARMEGFLAKWLADLRDGQTATGEYRCVAPTGKTDGGVGRTGWADAGVIVPYRLWRMSGDTSFIREHFASMTRYVDRIARTKHASCAPFEFADWLSFEKLETRRDRINARSPLKPQAERWWRYLGACYWLMDARMMRDMCRAVGDTAGEVRYARMSEEALAFAREFLDPDGLLFRQIRDMQTANLLALRLGVFRTHEAAERAKGILLDNIASHGNCLQTGFLGTSVLMDTLTDIGATDVAYTLLLQRKCPSWLYTVDQGATTIWERWNSYTKEKGFGPVDMNSFNHYAYGAVVGWLFSTAAGIRPDPAAGGWRRFELAPHPDRRLGSCRAEFDGGFGRIVSDWRYRVDGALVWSFEIPTGTVAVVRSPDGSAGEYAAGTHELVFPERKRVEDAGLVIQLDEGDLTEKTRPLRLEAMRKAGADGLEVAVCNFYKTGAERTAKIEKIAKDLRFFADAGFEPTVWTSTIGYGGYGDDPDFRRRFADCRMMRCFDGTERQLACTTDERYLDAVCENIRDFIRAGARFILLDDDLVQAHRPDLGCVCDEHLRRTAARAGLPSVSAADVKASFTGGPNPVRTAFVDTLGETLLAFARRIRAAADEIDPSVGIGLCSSDTIRDLDGIDLGEMLLILAGRGHRPFVRLSGAPYWVADQNGIGSRRYVGQGLGSVLEFVRWQKARFAGTETVVCDENDTHPRNSAVVPAEMCELYDRMTIAAGGLVRMKYILRADCSKNPAGDVDPAYLSVHLAGLSEQHETAAAFRGAKPYGFRVWHPERLVREETLPESFMGCWELKAFFTHPMAGVLLAANGAPVQYSEDAPGAAFGRVSALSVPRDSYRLGLVLDRAGADALAEKGIDLGLRAADARRIGEWTLGRSGDGLFAVCDKTWYELDYTERNPTAVPVGEIWRFFTGRDLDVSVPGAQGLVLIAAEHSDGTHVSLVGNARPERNAVLGLGPWECRLTSD